MGDRRESLRIMAGVVVLTAAVFAAFSLTARAPEPPVSIGIEFPPKDQSRLLPPAPPLPLRNPIRTRGLLN